MKNKPLNILSCLSLCAALFLPLSAKAAQNPNVTIGYIQSLYKQHHTGQALQKARAYRGMYPKDPDVHFYLGLIHYRQKQYAAAAQEFRTVLRLYPNYAEARKFLNRSLKAQNYSGKTVATVPVVVDPEMAQYNIANAYYEKKDYYAANQALKSIAKTNAKAYQFYRTINEETAYHYLPHFEIGVNTFTMPVNRPDETWMDNTLFASYVNRFGTFSVEDRQAKRLGNYGYQYRLVAWPNITKYLYLHLMYGHSDRPELFANNDYLGEVYFNYRILELSGGAEYREISRTNLASYWLGLGAWYDNFYAQFSPIFFKPKSGPDSVLYRFKVRRYFSTPDKYIGIVFATGQSPDLADLLTVNFFKTNYTYVMLEGQCSYKGYALLNYGVGYSWQKFPQGFTRRMVIFNLGTTFRFV